MEKVKIGTAGWSYSGWKGVVYPKSQKDTLSYIIEYLDCVEINTTFYRFPSLEYCEKWAKKASGRNFDFIVKANRVFTHEKSFEKHDAIKFIKAILPLGKIPLLFQFPFYFSYNDKALEHIEKIAENFSDYTKILELRSNTFDNPDTIKKIHSFGFSFCLPDYPETSTSFNNQNITNGVTGYFRLHGRNYEKWFKKNQEVKSYEKYNYLYSHKEENEIVEKIKFLLNDVNVMYVIANNHYRGKAFVNALFLKSKLEGKKVKVPELLMREYPELKQININGNETLF